MRTVGSRVTEYLDKIGRRVTGDLEGEDLIRVLWLSSTLFFVVGGYWLLRSLKDPIMSTIDGVRIKLIHEQLIQIETYSYVLI